ncbi:MAG: hypothetical protein GJU72_15080 [Acidithiobacillus ferriphilus]|jgi:hypothetical protein|uniref:hypothetical protein n=1 Tax=Acidithiobacillus ferriphilus TaxID=1689834 RepID=UPI002431DF69|nr:hypothetical protein [Acidithiobacillus ferriphilus]MBW9250339.1 hypothetical protein [Acidithiobacillus ferriphilus]MBW9255772.1 hypothetical protein [Acidithiobacillus ferriphilus]
MVKVKEQPVKSGETSQPLGLDIQLGRILYQCMHDRDMAASDLKAELTNLRTDKRHKAKLRVRAHPCTRRCSACPHPVFQALYPDKSVERLSGFSPQLRALGYHRNLQEITQYAQLIDFNESLARKIGALTNLASRRSFELFQDMQTYLDDTSLKAVLPTFYPPDPIGPAYLLGFSCLAFTVERCNELLRALQDHIYQYSSGTIHTRYHKTKQGVLGLKIEHEGRNPFIPADLRWAIYLRGHDRQWFSSRKAIFQNRYQDGAPPKIVLIRNTPWVLTRTGNRRHIPFYQAAQRHLRSISTFRSRIISLSNRLTKDATLILKCHRERGVQAPIKYLVVRQKPKTPEDAIQLITRNK